MALRTSTSPALLNRRERSNSRGAGVLTFLLISLVLVPSSVAAQGPPASAERRDPCRLEVIPARAGAPARKVEVCESTTRRGRWRLQHVAPATTDGRSFDPEGAARQLAAARIKAAGGLLLSEPEDRPWGARMFQFKDPDGFKLGVSTPLKG